MEANLETVDRPFRGFKDYEVQRMRRAIDWMKEGSKLDTEYVKQQRADFYMQRMLDWLNIGYGLNLFPDYVNYTSRDGILPNKVQKYMPGIVLRETTRKGYNYNDIGLNGTPMYSELAHENPPCEDCY